MTREDNVRDPDTGDGRVGVLTIVNIHIEKVRAPVLRLVKGLYGQLLAFDGHEGVHVEKCVARWNALLYSRG